MLPVRRLDDHVHGAAVSDRASLWNDFTGPTRACLTQVDFALFFDFDCLRSVTFLSRVHEYTTVSGKRLFKAGHPVYCERRLGITIAQRREIKRNGARTAGAV